jgi:hypothetical protein
VTPSPPQSSSTAPTDNAQGASQLSWLDLIIIATLCLGAFSLGGYLGSHLPFAKLGPVSSLAAFQEQSGVPSASNKLATIQTMLSELRKKIAAEYIESVDPPATRSSSARKTPPPEDLESTGAIPSLESDANSLTEKQWAAQRSLAAAEQRAISRRLQTLAQRHWHEQWFRALASVLCLGLLILLILGVTRWAAIPISTGSIIAAAAVSLLLILLSQMLTWIAVVLALVLLSVLLLKGRHHAQGASGNPS